MHNDTIRWCDPGVSLDQFNRRVVKGVRHISNMRKSFPGQSGSTDTFYCIVSDALTPRDYRSRSGSHWIAVAVHISANSDDTNEGGAGAGNSNSD